MDTPHLLPGTELGYGKYRIVRFIGAGGFGCTYEAEFVPMRTRVAIKEFFVSSCCNRDATGAISLGASSQAALVNRLEEKFQIEAQRLFKLKHQGIVSVTDMLQENCTSYYVMDYIEGKSLQGTIESEGPLPEARALKYIGQVMDALEYVHGQNMLHLDIKPDNIMIDSNDNAILIDFGVSKQYDEVDGHNTSTIMGQTPGFAPLEQVGNRVKQFTPATDIYALGATLYCALTGMIPPSSADLCSETSTLTPLLTGTSPSTRQAIAAMMQPSVSKRPQSISAARQLISVPDPINKTKIIVSEGGTHKWKKKVWFLCLLVYLVTPFIFVGLTNYLDHSFSYYDSEFLSFISCSIFSTLPIVVLLFYFIPTVKRRVFAGMVSLSLIGWIIIFNFLMGGSLLFSLLYKDWIDRFALIYVFVAVVGTVSAFSIFKSKLLRICVTALALFYFTCVILWL